MGFLSDLLKPKKLFKIGVGIGLYMLPGMAMVSHAAALSFKAAGMLLIGSVFEPGKFKGLQRRQEMRAMVRSAIKPQEVLYGRPPRKSGLVTFFGTSGDEQQYLHYVLAVSECPVRGSAWIDAELIA